MQQSGIFMEGSRPSEEIVVIAFHKGGEVRYRSRISLESLGPRKGNNGYHIYRGKKTCTRKRGCAGGGRVLPTVGGGGAGRNHAHRRK